MLISRIPLAAWFACTLAGAEPPRTLPVTTAALSQPLLPLRIPGYELRVLETRKPVVLAIGGTQTEASLPVFFYAPDPIQVGPRAPLQKARDGLAALGQKETWTGAELQQVLESLDQALKLLTPELPPSRSAEVPPSTPRP